MADGHSKSNADTRRQFIIPGVLELPSSSESHSTWNWESNSLESDRTEQLPQSQDDNIIRHFSHDFTQDDDYDSTSSGSGSGSGL
jgi:hypothetical protein